MLISNDEALPILYFQLAWGWLSSNIDFKELYLILGQLYLLLLVAGKLYLGVLLWAD